jgi:hypothetical protein
MEDGLRFMPSSLDQSQRLINGSCYTLEGPLVTFRKERGEGSRNPQKRGPEMPEFLRYPN